MRNRLTLDKLIQERKEYSQYRENQFDANGVPKPSEEKYERKTDVVPLNRWFDEFRQALLDECNLRVRYSHNVAQNEILLGHYIIVDEAGEYKKIWGDDGIKGFDIYAEMQGRTVNVDLFKLADKRKVSIQ